MNEIVKFIQEHPHCTKFVCTTCGGQMGFRFDLERWVRPGSINLLESFKHITPDDLLIITEWQVYLKIILDHIPQPDRGSAVYPAWWNSLGSDTQYDIFAIRNAPAGSFDKGRDSAWIRNVIDYVIQGDKEKELEPLVEFLGSNVDQFPGLCEYRISVETRKKKRVEIEERILRERCEKEALEKAKREAEKIRQEKRKIEIFDNLSALDPKQRLIQILEEPAIPLNLVPDEWAIIPDDQLTGLNSRDLTHLVRLLKGKTSGKENSPWKRLRTQLYVLRQKVNKTERFPESQTKE